MLVHSVTPGKVEMGEVAIVINQPFSRLLANKVPSREVIFSFQIGSLVVGADLKGIFIWPLKTGFWLVMRLEN